MKKRESKIEIYLDDGREPLDTFRPPGSFTLDTSSLEDGPHMLRIVAIDRSGHRGIRKVPFEVRNGPGIAVDGLAENDIVEGKINVLVNAYGGAYEDKWEPRQAEWAWVAFILVVAWSMYYAVRQWNPGEKFAKTPTYGKVAAEAGSPMGEESLGAQLYRTSCASCHQNNGQGVPNVFPPLAEDPVVTAEDPSEHIRVVLFGKEGGTINGVSYSTKMPAWADHLSDREVAAVVNHERTSWGNKAPTVTEEDVEHIRMAGNSPK